MLMVGNFLRHSV